MNKKLFLIFAFLFLIFANIFNVHALGITPGRITINFKPGMETEIPFSVINNEHKSMEVALMVSMKSEMNNVITLQQNKLVFKPEEERKEVKYKVKLPDNLEAGLHTGEIIAVEIPRQSEEGTSIGATIAVISQLYVYVPCAGKCVDAELNVLNAEANSTATFIVPVINRGRLGIGEARAIIDIYDNGNKIASIETDSAAIQPEERKELMGKWAVSIGQGSYTAKVSVFFDSETKIFEKQFSVGSEPLSIESILVNDFSLGEIAKLKILVENKLNQELKNVYANLLVYNKQEQVMADVKSATENIPASNKKELVAYWDTVGVQEGSYNGKLLVYYDKKSAEKNLVLKISENSMDITGVGYAIRPKGSKGINMTTILTILVILLLIVNVAWFVFFRRMRRK